MCGFAGVLGRMDSVQRVASMGDLIEHRGPDQTGHFEQVVDFGQYRVVTKRLSIQDLSIAGNQPMTYQNYVLAFNGEIYNHKEIRRSLGASVSWMSSSDTETIVRAFAQWGVEQTLSRLNGVYSIALWNIATQTLMLARDPMGVKPLYYSRDESGISFSSELKAMTVGRSNSVSIKGLVFYLLFGYVPSPWSLIDGVYKLEPGEVLIFGGSCEEPIRSRRIVSLLWRESTDLPSNFNNRVSLLREILSSAVERQLLSDAPVGVFLSGGIDSTVIASLMASHGSYQSFGLSYSESSPEANSDAFLAEQYSRGLGWRHTTVQLSPATFTTHWEYYIKALDEPIAEPNFIGQILLSQAARNQGIKVVLTGDGADEIFHGYRSYFAVIKGDALNAIPFFGPVAKMSAYIPVLTREFKRNLLGASSVWRKSVSDRFWIIGSVLFDVYTIAGWLGLAPEEIILWVQNLAEAKGQDLTWPQVDDSLSNVERLARLELGTHVADHYNLRLDKATMSQSVEARVPFQDLEVVNIGMRLCQTDKMSKTQGKVILREAFRKELPVQVTERQKQTFQAPLTHWINGPLKPLRRRVWELSDKNPWHEWLSRDTKTAQEAHQLWALMVLDSWMAHYEVSL
ncbi:asparagine synthase (glutamine-hydrolyzing) [Sulfobacillus sp. hq2]|uniref:asparagine synthase (glutamine-hydrolyzing) n=1 Tax=Sulfobacillus TaxID=28033 RepID=UPI000CD1E04B|nr:asparagine synthase (glutamine-hydrolyzing) [Sulfobacillus sp. hq2]POB09373.1 asparagine synthase (glutamine-hydrolyzing) [Sulfobacillus sp. hq2]